jgi:hypothetical protein
VVEVVQDLATLLYVVAIKANNKWLGSAVAQGV